MYILLCLALFPLAKASFMITVYGDVMKDTKFFTKTYPWIIDNIGGHMGVEYFLLGSGRYSVPQMCALDQLQFNTFLQAQYLKCEAEGTKSEICLCSCGIDQKIYRKCVLEGGYLAGKASEKYALLKLDASPIVELWPRNTVFEVSDAWYLKKICTIFGEAGDVPRPLGCIKPFDCIHCNNNTVEFHGKRSVVDFNCYRYDSSENDCDSTEPTTAATSTISITNTPEYVTYFTTDVQPAADIEHYP